MHIKWLGHASFYITTDSGIRIITDPYESGALGGIHYDVIQDPADIVTVSHSHFDHNNAQSIKGNPQIVDKAGERTISGVRVKGIAAHHDTSGGKERGSNIIFCLDVDQVNVCHVGDLGHQPTQQQLAQMGQVDVLLVPVGGTYALDAKGANQLVETLRPGVVIPMHFKTPWCNLPIAAVDDFLKLRENVKRADSPEIELHKASLPTTTETVVLDPAAGWP